MAQRQDTAEWYEEQLLEVVGMKREIDYQIYNTIFTYENGESGHIHTIECGFENETPLVLVHGYGSGAVFYYKVMAELKAHFHIYSIDLYGMGSSAKPEIKDFAFDKVVSFFVDALECWRKEKKLTDFVLMGHSMGGYLSSQWVATKSPPIRYLYLLSPAGFSNKTDEELYSPEVGVFQKTMYWTYDKLLHQKKMNPLSLVPFKEYFIKKKFMGKAVGMSDHEAEIAVKYISKNMNNKSSAEIGVGVLLRYARYSQHPISELLLEIRDKKGFSFPIVVIYGEKDWMDFNHSIKVNDEMKLGLEIGFIPNCDHQIILQNPKGLCEKMIGDLNRGYDILRQVDLYPKPRSLSLGIHRVRSFI